MPKSAWLSTFRFTNTDGAPVLKMHGYVYLENQQDEIVEVNKFLNNLREDSDFKVYFKKVVMDSVTQESFGKQGVTSFDITCEGLRGEK